MLCMPTVSVLKSGKSCFGETSITALHHCCVLLLVLWSLFCCRNSLANVVYLPSDGERSAYKGQINKDGAWVYNEGADKTISIATLDWMPHIGENMCGQGWVQQLVTGILISRGYEVHSYFLPWKRAVAKAEMGKVDALYPEYSIAEYARSVTQPDKIRNDFLVLSQPFTGGQVALVKRKEFPFEFSGNMAELEGFNIGIVAGYENSPEFDAYRRTNRLSISEVTDDWTNIRKLHGKRVDLIVVDPLIIEYTAMFHLGGDESRRLISEFEVLQPYLSSQSLHLAFSRAKSDTWQAKLQDFNDGLMAFQKSGWEREIRQHWMSKSVSFPGCF